LVDVGEAGREQIGDVIDVGGGADGGDRPDLRNVGGSGDDRGSAEAVADE